MKVVCIDNSNLEDSGLVVGRIYKVLYIIKSKVNHNVILCVIVVNDVNKVYAITRFKLLSKFRNEKINKLLNN
ncbi:MAG: hypothetical protein M0R46_06255 [Candidatus Muirbacterium halophilum]|nr:hypothetical protein [Candidatus Muirbacterium halophilum]